MPVFKAFFKILKSQKVSIAVYIGIFLAITLIYSGVGGSSATTSFEESITRVAIFNEDESNEITEGLKDYLAPHAEYIEMEDSSERIQDALFFRAVEYVIRIPKGFTQQLMKGEQPQLSCIIIPDSSAGVYIDLLIEEYLNTCKLYLNNVDGLTKEQIAEYVKKDLSIQTEVKLKEANKKNNLINYINYLAYAFLSIFTVGLSAIINVLNKSMIKKRNSCSPMKPNNINLQILLGCTVFTVVVWGGLTGIGFVINQQSIFTEKGICFGINSFVLALCTASISFLVGLIVTDKKTTIFICNILSLGLCLISGVFVPQSFLGSEVIKIACFNPVYWFVKANEGINTATNITLSSSVVRAIGIQVVFAAVITMIALVISKKKKLDY